MSNVVLVRKVILRLKKPQHWKENLYLPKIDWVKTKFLVPKILIVIWVTHVQRKFQIRALLNSYWQNINFSRNWRSNQILYCSGIQDHSIEWEYSFLMITFDILKSTMSSLISRLPALFQGTFLQTVSTTNLCLFSDNKLPYF